MDISERRSDALGGLYAETGLFEGPSANWGVRHAIQLVPTANPDETRGWWRRICEDLSPMEAHFGHEGRVPRPRVQDTYLAVWLDESLAPGKGCGDGRLIGLAWLQRPYPGIRAYGFGLFPECRKLGHGVDVKESILALCFGDPNIHRVETEVYSSNPWSLRVLHGVDDPMTREGVQREVMLLNGRYYDRVLFGITREEWALLRQQGRG